MAATRTTRGGRRLIARAPPHATPGAHAYRLGRTKRLRLLRVERMQRSDDDQIATHGLRSAPALGVSRAERCAHTPLPCLFTASPRERNASSYVRNTPSAWIR